ncbi:MAG: diacylglycerol kinase family protein [Candidatus Saganbacteria bacterium]|nr:diacylglycerol kinase family protein [Candidatus Saganbacteria bacterium]
MPRKLARSITYALRGIRLSFRSQRNLSIHLFTGSIAFLLAIILHISVIEMVVILVVIGLVIVAEMLNTAMEEIVNLFTLSRKIRAMVAKDVAAGAVLVACSTAVVVGCMIFLHRIVNILLRGRL